MRQSAKKILVVITDGESHDRNSMERVVSQAERKGIVRFAIGVGFSPFTYDHLNILHQIPEWDCLVKILLCKNLN